MPASIVDRIPEAEDMDSGGNEWLLVTAPLRSAIANKVDADPQHLYVQPGGQESAVPTLLVSGDLTAVPADLATILASPILQPQTTPILLIGNAGVGKSSWIRFFIHCVGARPNLTTIYYSQKHESGRPVFDQLDPVQKFRRILFRMLTESLRQICVEIGMTGLGIFDYDLGLVDSGKFDRNYEFTKALEAAVEATFAAKHSIILIIDDLDNFGDDLQLEAFRLGTWLSRMPGMNVVLPMRPFTYSNLDVAQTYRPRRYVVRPPNLANFLSHRLRYEWDVRPSEALLQLKEMFSKEDVSVNLVVTGVLEKGLEGLRRFHQLFINVLSENEHLQRALYSLHNENIDTIGSVISEMMQSKFIYEQYKGDLETDIPTLKTQEKIITAYLRGRFRHYRGPTEEYPVSDIAILNVTGIPNERAIAPIRVLHYLSSRESGKSGTNIAEIVGFFEKFGYESADIQYSVRYLVGNGMIYGEKAGVTNVPEATGNVTISAAGKYLVQELLDQFAFRFCEANGDVLRRALGKEVILKPRKRLPDMAENAVVVMDLVVTSWEHEAQAVAQCKADGKIDHFNQYQREMLSGVGSGWITRMAEEVFGRVSTLEHSAKGMGEMNRIQNLINGPVKELQARITKVEASLHERH